MRRLFVVLAIIISIPLLFGIWWHTARADPEAPCATPAQAPLTASWDFYVFTTKINYQGNFFTEWWVTTHVTNLTTAPIADFPYLDLRLRDQAGVTYAPTVQEPLLYSRTFISSGEPIRGLWNPRLGRTIDLAFLIPTDAIPVALTSADGSLDLPLADTFT